MEIISVLSIGISIVTFVLVFYYQKKKDRREMYVSLIDRFDTLIVNFLDSTLNINTFFSAFSQKGEDSLDEVRPAIQSANLAQRKASSYCDIIKIHIHTNKEERKLLEESKKAFFKFSGLIEKITKLEITDIASINNELAKSKDNMVEIREMIIRKQREEFSSIIKMICR